MLFIYLKMEAERVRLYDCKHCSKVFLTKSGLKRHMSGHLTVKPFKCQMCGTGFCHKSSFKRHILKNSCTPVDMSKPQTHKLVEKLSRSQYSCPVCGVGFAHKYTFKTHMVMNMCKVLETEQNSLSGSSSIENLSQEESLTVINSNVPKKSAESPDLGMNDETMEKVAAHDSQETCIVCRKIFPSKADLELHVKDHLKKKSKSFTKPSGIKNTDEDSTQNLLKVFSCKLCGKITKTFMGLNAHSRHCTGSVKNKCSVCDRSFTKPCLLRRHMKRHGINLHMGRVKRRKFPKSVAYVDSEPPSPDMLTGTNLHMKNQAVSLRKETVLFGKAASTEDEHSDDYDEMTVYITEEQVEERELLECDRLDKSDHSVHIAEDPLIDHSTDDICDSSDLCFLENSQRTGEERIVQSNNSIESVVHRVHDKFMEPVPDICLSNQKSACSSINLCSATNISASHITDNGCSDAYNVSYNKNTESNNYLTKGSIEYNELHSSLSVSEQIENSGLDPVTITNEINLSESSSYIQAQVESSVAEGMCQENCGNEFSVKRKEITTVYIEEDLNEEVELFEELTRTTTEKNCTSADPLTRDLLGSEKVFSEDKKPDFPDQTEHKYSCNICRMTFNQKNTLRKHMTEHGEKQKFKCSVCWGDFLFESDLAKHMESHEKSQQYTCNFCGLNFVKKCGLVGHLKTHLDVQSFSCDMCDKTFATKTPFIKHRREHNAKKRNVLEIVNNEQENSALETQENNRLDEIAPSGKEFNKESVLTSFTVVFGLETSEGNAYDRQVARKYKCNVCERMFNGRVGLKRHLKKHDNPSLCISAKDIKPVSFDCDVCHKQFRKRNHLARHYSVHKNYSCSVCQQTFKSERTLTFHYKEHVKDEKLLDQDMTNASDPQYSEFDKEYEPNPSDLDISIETCSKENPPEKVISVRETFLTETDNIADGTIESKTSQSLKQHGKLVISNNQQEKNTLYNNQNIMPDVQQETTSLFRVQQKKTVPEQGDDNRQVEDKLHKRKFVCHTCGRTFNKKSCLSMHSHIHKGNRPFSCPMCPLTFLCDKSLNVHLYQHKKLSSPDTGKEVFRIKNVNPKKVAKSSPPVNDASPIDSLGGGDGERKKLIRECRLAGPRLQDSDEILLACLYCNKRCLTKSALANHIKTHTEFEHFPCKLCGVTFYFEDTLLSHKKKYHNLDQTNVSHRNNKAVESKEEHSVNIEIRSKESEIAMSLSAIDENVKLGCESEKNIPFSCSGNETKGRVGDSKPPCQEGLHLRNMPDVSEDNFVIQKNPNKIETYENNFVEGQSPIGRTMTEVADKKRKLRYVCSVCGKVFLYHRMYMRHKLLRCRRTNAYTCQNLGCDRSFSRRYNLNRHMKVHFKSKLGLLSKKIVKRNLYNEVKRNLYNELNYKSKFKNKASLEYNTESVVSEHNHNLCGMEDLKESDHEHIKVPHSVSSFPDTYEFREEVDDEEKGQIALKEFRIKKQEDQTLSDPRKLEPYGKCAAAITSTKEPTKLKDPLTINQEEQYNHISPTSSCESDEIVEKLSEDDSEGDNFMWRNKQSKKRKVYSCKVCNINLLRYQSFTNHMKLHKELSVSDLKCSSCGKCFSNEPELVMHEKTHSSELVIDDDSKHLLEKKKGTNRELSPNVLLNEDCQSSPALRLPVSGQFISVKATSEIITEKETLRDLAPKSKRIRLQKCEYDCKVCGRLILHAVDFVMHLSFHRDRDELLHSYYGPSDHLYDVIQLIVQTPTCNVCRKVFCICQALGLGEDQDIDMYKCDVCEMKFMVRWSLADHMSQHGDTIEDSLMIKDMKAYLIKTIGNVNSSDDIMRKKESEGGRFHCSICGKTTENAADYILHLKTHERAYSYKCGFCQKSFKKKLARNNHMRIHKKTKKDHLPKDPFKQEEKQNLGSLSTKKDSEDANVSEKRHEELCKRKGIELSTVVFPRNEVDNGCFKSTEGIIGERENKETSSSEKNVSVHCEVFGNTVNIGTKQENRQNDGNMTDVSSVSNKSTRNNAAVSSKEAYVCPVCNESFTRYQKLLSHEKVHFEPVMYDCEKCKHFFQCKEDYDEHLKTHSSRNFSKYYGCPVCGKKMANHANFLRHCASHSPMHNSQTLGSSGKDKSFENTLVLKSLDGEDSFLSADQKREMIKPLVPSSVIDLDTELGSENENKPADLLAGIRDYKLLEAKKSDGSEEKSLHCKFCDLVFTSLVDFHKHNLIHDFTCKFCGHTFSRKSKYKMHVKRHSAKDKRCKRCWRRFLRNREFELHKKTHTIESVKNGDSSAQDDSDLLSKHPIKANLKIDENESKIKEKGCRNKTSKLVNYSTHLENEGLDYDDLKMLNLEQDPLNSHENVTILNNPEKGGTTEAGLRVQKLLDKKLHKCCVCGKSFPSYAKYLEHKKVHSKDPQVTCSICKQRFGIRAYVEHIDDLNCMACYSCFQCGKQFSDHQLFTDHCKEHDIMNETEKLATPDADPLTTGNDSSSCPNVTEKLDCLKLALDSVMSNSNACHICHRKCESSYILNIHMEDHFKNKPFKCDICLKSLQSKQKFKKHLENHLLNSFICRICNKSFTHQYMLVSHLQKKHTLTLESAMLLVEVQDEEKCDEAVERDESVSTCNIVAHGTCDVIPGVVESFICSICSKSFSHKYKLVTHLRKSHKLELEQAKQLAAEAQFKERVNVTETEESESSSTFVQRDGLVSTAYESELELKAKEISVGKREKKKKMGEDLPSVISDTSVDKISVSGRKSLVCPLCGKVCSCRSNLNDHVISHSSDKPWRCPDCKIKFKRLWDRNRHIRNKHGCDPKTLLAKFGGTVRGLDSASTRYDCAVCDKRFLYDSVLKMHMMFHTGESSLDYVACEEEEFYECAVERNEDDGLPGLERVLQETRSNDEKVFVADYLDREYNTEDAAIEIKEEIIDIDDVEDIITEDFDVFSDLVLEPERDSLQHSPLPSVGEESGEMNALSLDRNDVMDVQNEKRENVNISESNACSIVTDKNSDSLQAEELPNVDECLESLNSKSNEMTCDIKSTDVTSSGLNTCGSYLDLNNEINRKNMITDETSNDMGQDQLGSVSQDNVCCGSKGTEMENADANSLHANRDAESDNGLAKDTPLGLGLSELSREVKMLIETRERKRKSFVSKKNVYCSLCDLYFSTQRQLFGHIHIHSGCVFYQCDVCGETLKNSKQYKEHALSHITDYFDCNDEAYYIIKKETGKSTKFSCSICGKSFASRHQLTGHLHVHSREFTRSCEACGETFESNRLAVNHLYEHLTLLFKGPTAAQIREVTELKEVHSNNLPSVSELEYSHQEISTNMTESYEKQDNNGNKEVGSRSAEPELCHNKIITHNDSVSCHEEMTVSSEEEKITNIGSESYHDTAEIINENPEYISAQMNATTTSSESCQEEFSHTPELCHKEINTSTNPPESFHEEDEITSDMPKGFHKDSPEICSMEVRTDIDKPKVALVEPELTPCESEMTSFESEYSPTVELSESTVHNKEINSSKETNKPDADFKPYSCMYCSKLFLRKDSMRIHMRLHTGDRILECDVCSKTFVKKSHLTKHMKVHSKSFSN